MIKETKGKEYLFHKTYFPVMLVGLATCVAFFTTQINAIDRRKNNLRDLRKFTIKDSFK